MKYAVFKAETLTYKGRMLVNALAQANPNAQLVTRYQPCDVMIIYGLGGDDRQPVAKQQWDAGGTLVAMDVGYWARRYGVDRKWRVAINDYHSPQYIMRGERPSSSRWKASGLSIDKFKPTSSDIMVVGNAPKSNKVGAEGWTAAKSRELRNLFPGRAIVYRPKPKRPMEEGVDYDKLSRGPIDNALRRVGLVVCRHSNVAVDACRVGVPVVCEDGAAAAIYPGRLIDHHQQPDYATRKEFLIRLAWWQWSIREIQAGQFWPWLERTLAAIQ